MIISFLAIITQGYFALSLILLSLYLFCTYCTIFAIFDSKIKYKKIYKMLFNIYNSYNIIFIRILHDLSKK